MAEVAEAAVMERVGLCPWRMQACNRGEALCPVGRVAMGESVEGIMSVASECPFAGDDLPPYFYRSLTYSERKRYGVGLVANV